MSNNLRVESYPKQFTLHSTSEIFAETQDELILRPTVFTVKDNVLGRSEGSTVVPPRLFKKLYNNGLPHFLSIVDVHLAEVARSVEADVVPHEWVLLEGVTLEDEIEDHTSLFFPELDGFVLGAVVKNTKQHGYNVIDNKRIPTDHAVLDTWYQINQTLEDKIQTIKSRQGWSINDLSTMSQFSGDLPINDITSMNIWRNANPTLIDIEPRITLA